MLLIPHKQEILLDSGLLKWPKMIFIVYLKGSSFLPILNHQVFCVTKMKRRFPGDDLRYTHTRNNIRIKSKNHLIAKINWLVVCAGLT